MYSMTTQITNQLGLHARPASDLTLKAKEFSSNISLSHLDAGESNPVDVKSIIQILAGRFYQGSQVEITAEGDDERQAVEALVELVEGGFGE